MGRTDPWEDTGLFPLVSQHGAPRNEETRERPWKSPGRPPWVEMEGTGQRPAGLLRWLALVIVIVLGAAMVAVGLLWKAHDSPRSPECGTVSSRDCEVITREVS